MGKRLAALLMQAVLVLSVLLSPDAQARPSMMMMPEAHSMMMSCGAGHHRMAMPEQGCHHDAGHAHEGDCCTQSACSATLPDGPSGVFVVARRTVDMSWPGLSRPQVRGFRVAPDTPPPRLRA
ncbi:hypothetical protein [Acetobacter oeni]|nr:hypothetical protein [Acetobacter oeni]MBB3881911.1 hypothetical protein [Acetobacter oeni]NHO17766.1 hypothetical protein [Acetobacter oeni]